MMTTAPLCRNQCFRQTGPVISEITGLDSAAAVWLVIVSDLSYISSDHYTLFNESFSVKKQFGKTEDLLSPKNISSNQFST